jgi:hypothetical protein
LTMNGFIISERRREWLKGDSLSSLVLVKSANFCGADKDQFRRS